MLTWRELRNLIDNMEDDDKDSIVKFVEPYDKGNAFIVEVTKTEDCFVGDSGVHIYSDQHVLTAI